MLSFFRSNQIFAAILLALYIFLVHLGALMGAVQAPPFAGDAGLVFQSWFDWAGSEPFFSAITATFLVFVQALTVNVLADEFRFMGERNWLPGLFYALSASILPEFLFLSGPLVAATFIPFSLWSIYKAYQKPNVTGSIFDAGLWIGVASLFYPPCLWLLVAAFAGIDIVRVFRLRERFVFLTGAFVPLFLVWLWYFWIDQGSEFRTIHLVKLFQVYHFDADWGIIMMFKSTILVVLTIVFLFGLRAFYSRKSIQAQKFVSVLYWYLLVAGLSLLTRPEWRWEHLLLAAAAMGILLSLTFQSIHKRLWAEFWHLIILAFVLFIQFADYLLSISYSIF
ncbi:MAG: hypothetical protein ACKVT2_00405 [Saprospiraceae bacterium]